MCKTESERREAMPTYGWDEVKKHTSKTDSWIVIDGMVYDVTSWKKRHPGGEKMIQHMAGQDATDAWVAFHNDKDAVRKYLRPLCVGHLAANDNKETELMKDFRELRATCEKMGLFQPSVTFYTLVMAHIFALELIGWAVVTYYGHTWLGVLLAAVILTTAQNQAGWAQHDYGHHSVFSNSKINKGIHIFLLNFFKGVASSWWNYRHYLHHSKPNTLRKDPDIRLEVFFLLGKVQPVEFGKKKKGFMNYSYQHKYFYFLFPPLLIPLYFHYEVPYYLWSRRNYFEMFWMACFYVRYMFMFVPTQGFLGGYLLYMFIRFLESHWFVWTTQMNHIPMTVDYDQEEDWVTSQLKATCNVEKSLFNDWFSGHLNFQIEHHLFPTMPRHNLYKAAPLVQSMCKKHGLDYQVKTLSGAMGDIVGSLKESGELWLDAYNM